MLAHDTDGETRSFDSRSANSYMIGEKDEEKDRNHLCIQGGNHVSYIRSDGEILQKSTTPPKYCRAAEEMFGWGLIWGESILTYSLTTNSIGLMHLINMPCMRFKKLEIYTPAAYEGFGNSTVGPRE